MFKKIIQQGLKEAASKVAKPKKTNAKNFKPKEYKEPSFEQKRDNLVGQRYKDTTDGRMQRYEKLFDLYKSQGKKEDDTLKRVKDSVFKKGKAVAKKKTTKKAVGGSMKKKTVKKKMGGKIGRGCGAALRGSGKVMK